MLFLRLENGNWGELGRGLKVVGFCKIGELVCDSGVLLDIMDFGESKWFFLVVVLWEDVCFLFV